MVVAELDIVREWLALQTKEQGRREGKNGRESLWKRSIEIGEENGYPKNVFGMGRERKTDVSDYPDATL